MGHRSLNKRVCQSLTLSLSLSNLLSHKYPSKTNTQIYHSSHTLFLSFILLTLKVFFSLSLSLFVLSASLTLNFFSCDTTLASKSIRLLFLVYPLLIAQLLLLCVYVCVSLSFFLSVSITLTLRLSDKFSTKYLLKGFQNLFSNLERFFGSFSSLK